MKVPISGESMIRLREVADELDQLHSIAKLAAPEFERMGEMDAATEFERLVNMLGQTYDQAARTLEFVSEAHKNEFPKGKTT